MNPGRHPTAVFAIARCWGAWMLLAATGCQAPQTVSSVDPEIFWPPPPAQRISSDVPDNAPQLPVNIDIPNIDVGTAGGSGPYIGNWTGGDPKAEGEAIPIVRINPRYPRQALLNGIEGYVRLEFTILEDGTVKDVVVAESRPGQVFDRSAVLAVMKWKFKPRIIDGKAVPRRATSTVEFVMDENE